MMIEIKKIIIMGLKDQTSDDDNKGRPHIRKIDFFRALPKLPLPPLPLPPIRASCTTFIWRQKCRLAHITEPSNDDYDNDVSDHNFGTFDDFGVKND